MTTVAITSVTNPVDSGNVTTFAASGTTDAGTNTVAVNIVDGDGTTIGPVVATVIGTTWSIAATDVSTLDDGTLIVEATATDLAAVQAFTAKAVTKEVVTLAVSVTTVTNPIDSQNVTAVVASGTTNVSTNTVTVTIVDSSGGTVGPITATVIGTSWSIAATDVTTLNDGTLIVEATASDVVDEVFAAKTTTKATTVASYISVADFRAYIKDTSSSETAVIQASCAAASRMVDAYCGRPFYQITSTQYFTPEPGNLWILRFGDADLATTDGIDLHVDWGITGAYAEAWTLNTDYIAEPVNQSVNGIAGWPFTFLRSVAGKIFPYHYVDYQRDTVKITGTWGWPAVPDPVKQATLILAADLYKLGDAPFGVAGFGQYGAIRVKDNPRACSLLQPYRKTTALLLA